MNLTVARFRANASAATSAMQPFQRHALLVALFIAVTTTALMPGASAQWPAVSAFLPAYQTATICCYAVVAYLIYGYFKQTRLHALLYLLGGCVYTSAILLVQFFAFPSAFFPDIRLLGGSQTPSWLWFFWHLGSTGMLLGYAVAKWRGPGRLVTQPGAALWKCTVLTACALTASVLAVTAFHDALPIVDVAGDFSRITRTGYAPLIQVVIVVALWMLWRATRFRTPMHAWLGVAMVALIFDNAITMAGGTRLSVGWYVGRINALASAFVMLILYLKEVNRVYLNAAANADQLAVANTLLETEHTRMLDLFEQAPGFVAVLAGEDDRIELHNAAFQRLVGDRVVVGQPIREALPELDGQGYFELIDAIRRHGRAHVGSGMKITLTRAADGVPEERYIDVLFQPNVRKDGQGTRIFVQGSDVTEQRLAQLDVERQQQLLETLVLERTKKLEETQTALMHAQKMEAIGKLTGGVAHDFNNVLHIIGGNIDLIKMVTPANEPVHLRCTSAQTAIRRGAKLSSQLLSFARKQPLQPDVVSLPDVFHDIDLLLKRAVGERVDVRLAIEGTVWNTLVDPQQLENVILNLALNASDAMADAGSLTISVRNLVRPDGDYVLLAFTDTGHGMTDEVKSRAFEPFFSTKGLGKGTGLGMSMAHGFVHQSGGHIAIDSTVGAGTTITILLPRSDALPATRMAQLAIAEKGGNETIMVVDDEQAILDNVAAILRDAGYRVLTAGSADEAMEEMGKHGRIDLLFTDVIMPGVMSATELAERACALHPRLRVLFTSGYTENAMIHNGRLDKGINLLSKPYGRAELASAVRTLLSAQVPVSAPAPAPAPAA
ncbi:MAG: MASE4 domain-containing protein [Pseudomonadota bacterium]|nr:MASE4 domain-containing protein [Pseudomonadota bacterium]